MFDAGGIYDLMYFPSWRSHLRTGDEPAGPSNCFGALCDLDGLEVDDGWPWPRSRVWSHVMRWSYLKDLEGTSWTHVFW